MDKCRNLNNINSKNYNGYGFETNDNDGNPSISYGKFVDGGLEYGIRCFKKSTTLQMGYFHTAVGNGNDLAYGYKRFPSGDVCISKEYEVVKGVGLTGVGYSLYIYKNGSWCYGKLVDGKMLGKTIYYDGYKDKVYYREYDGDTYSNEQELDVSKYNLKLKANINRSESIYYNLDKAIFNDIEYSNCDVYSMGGKVTNSENGLGFYHWHDGEKYIGELQDGKRHGFGVYHYVDNHLNFAYYYKGERTNYYLTIYDDGAITFGDYDGDIPRFQLHKNGDFSVRNTEPGNSLYIDGNFGVSIEEYGNDGWVKTIEKYNIKCVQDKQKINNVTLGLGQAEEELNKLIGLDSVKKELKRIKAYLTKYKDEKLNLHMVFTGCPGTGKTVVARLLGKILYEEKILPKDKFVEASRQSLIGQYIGETAIKTNKAIEDAMGGVLFIDEAYSLNARSERDFGHEAVAELLKKMEDERGNFCCIMAGYTKEMEDFIAINPGFKSRVQFFIDFPNYKKVELKQIAQIFLKKKKLIVSDEVVDKIIDIVWLKEKDKDFSNAREVRILIDKLTMIQSERTIGDDDNREITLEDIETYTKEHKVDFAKPIEESTTKEETDNTPIEESEEEVQEKPVEEEIVVQHKLPMLDYFDLRQIAKEYQPKHYMADKLNLLESIVAITEETQDGVFESSGFIISDDGYIVTAAHCVNHTKAKIRVRRRISDRLGNKVDVYYDGDIVAIDDENDIAILKIEVDGHIPYLTLLNEKAIDFEPTHRIAMLGYPFGVSRFDNLSIVEGQISSYQKIKNKRKIINLVCDAKDGNSGSCVVDIESGVVIGVLSGAHIKEGQEFAEEINYCIPVEYVWKLIKKHQDD